MKLRKAGRPLHEALQEWFELVEQDIHRYLSEFHSTGDKYLLGVKEKCMKFLEAIKEGDKEKMRKAAEDCLLAVRWLHSFMIGAHKYLELPEEAFRLISSLSGDLRFAATELIPEGKLGPEKAQVAEEHYMEKVNGLVKVLSEGYRKHTAKFKPLIDDAKKRLNSVVNLMQQEGWRTEDPEVIEPYKEELRNLYSALRKLNNAVEGAGGDDLLPNAHFYLFNMSFPEEDVATLKSVIMKALEAIKSVKGILEGRG
jgi:hypothetical protein